MKTVYDESRNAFSLSEPLARGGQGVVWRLAGHDNHLVKIYHSPLSRKETDKQRVLRNNCHILRNVAALPVSLAFDDALLLRNVGVFIPFIGGVEIFELYGTRSRLKHFPNATFQFLVFAAYNLAAAFEELHSHGIVVGDVNEQNIKVLPDATVRFIDTDSFQIRNGENLYTSDVGTPLWTPPELHGRNLTGLERTTNHDLFGLAQLIFLLLFAGRHPFSGVPKTQNQFLPEEAIQQHAFAFAPPEMGMPVGPPPGAPRLEMLPVEIREAFSRAFLKDSVLPNARPTANRWRQLLDRLRKTLVVCAQKPSHIYWGKADSCPWCGIHEEAGVDIFPAPLGAPRIVLPNPVSSDASIGRWAGMRPHPFTVTKPPSFSNVPPSPLPPRPKGFWNGVYKLFFEEDWKRSWLHPSIHACNANIKKSEAQMQAARTAQQKIIAAYNQSFSKNAEVLNPIIYSLNNTYRIREAIKQTVIDERRQVALNDYLQGFPIRHSKIPQIGPARLATLLSFGIETAADIDRRTLSRAALPLNAVDELLKWKRHKQTLFRFEQSLELSESEKQLIERRTQERVKALREEAAALEVKMNEITNRTQSELRALDLQITQFARSRAQAMADLTVLQRELQ